MALRRIIRIISSRTTTTTVNTGDDVADRRRSPRLAFYARCDIYDHTRFQSRPRGRIVNLGLQGLALEAPFLFGPGDDFTLSFDLPSHRFNDAVAVVRWSRQNSGSSIGGLQFSQPNLGRQLRQSLVKRIESVRL